MMTDNIRDMPVVRAELEPDGSWLVRLPGDLTKRAATSDDAYDLVWRYAYGSAIDFVCYCGTRWRWACSNPACPEYGEGAVT